MRHFAMCQNLVHVMTRHVNRNRKSDPLVAARVAGEDGGIDANQVAFVIDQCAAGVAGIDRSVGLDEVFQLLDPQARRGRWR